MRPGVVAYTCAAPGSRPGHLYDKGLYPETLAEHGIWDGHLADTEAYRLVRLAPSGILSEKASWASLAVRTCAPVSGHTER